MRRQMYPGRGVSKWRARRFLAVAIGLMALTGMVGLAGCSSSDDDKDALAYQERPVEEIYNQAMDYLLKQNYRRAAIEFDEVERQHPYSSWARRATLMAAYAYYQLNKYDEGILAAERFIALHPGNRDAPYAYYLIALSYYEQISDVGRDQKITENALAALQEVVRRFPQSEYARDGQLKIDLTRDHLAGKEMEIGRYYLNQRAYVAAINRFRNVIEYYQTTTHVPEALHRLTEAYLSLGVQKEAQTAAAVLGYNYPGSRWYEDSYGLLSDENLQPEQDENSWISKVWTSVF